MTRNAARRDYADEVARVVQSLVGRSVILFYFILFWRKGQNSCTILVHEFMLLYRILFYFIANGRTA